MYFGDQLAFLFLVANFRFLSAKCGPIRLTSTYGLKVWVFGVFRSFAATTKKRVVMLEFEGFPIL